MENIKKLFILMFVFIMLVGTASALEFDNIKGKPVIDNSTSIYGKIEIRDWFGLKKLAELELKENTDVCGESCSSETEIVLYEDAPLIDDVRFMTIKEDGSEIEQPIRSYQFFIQTGVKNEIIDDYQLQCSISGYSQNGSEIENCKNVKIGSHINQIPEWDSYSLGTIMPSGNYYIKLEGEKKPTRTVDWQITSQGKLIDDWAVWGAGGSLCYQESTNQSTAGDGSCGLNYGGSWVNHSIVGSVWNNLNNAYDTNWGTFANRAAGGDTLTTNITYMKPQLGTIGAFWQVKDESASINLTIPDSCFNAYSDKIVLTANAGNSIQWLCFNGTGVQQLRDTNNNLYEEAIIWNVSFSAVILNSPVDNYASQIAEVKFNCSATVSGATLTNISLFHNATGTFELNQTEIVSGVSNNTLFNATFNSDESYLWNCQGCDNDGDCGFSSANRTFSIDIIPPQITINEPQSIVNYGYVGKNEILNWSITESNLDSIWYNYNETNITLYGAENTTNFILELNNYNLTFYANDSLGGVNSTFIVWEYNIFEGGKTYENSTVEGSLETFTMNLTLKTDLSLSQASFIYNGTEYSSSIGFSGGTYLLSSSITIPLITIDSNMSFFFNMTVNGTEYSSSINSQFVEDLQLSVCGVSSNDTLLNMSLVDEMLRTPLGGEIQISGKIISKTSGEVVETISQEFVNTSSASICFSPLSSYNLYLFDAEIRYTSTGYASELYIIQKADLGNYPLNLTLYDLNSSSSTEFLVKYQGNDLIAVEGAIIQLLRKYIANDTYEVVEAPLTSNIGTVVLHIDLDTNLYQAIVVKDGVILDTFTTLVFNCESILSGQCTQNLFGSIDPRNFVSSQDLEDFSLIIYELNNTITTVFSIPSGTPTSVNINLKQTDLFGNSTLCNQTIYSSAGSVDCTYDTTIGDSIVDLEISKGGIIQAQKSYYIRESGGVDWLGNNFFIVLILLLSLTGMAVSSPEWIVVNGIITFIIGGGVWLLNGLDFVVGLGGIMWLFVGGGILIFKLTTQEDR